MKTSRSLLLIVIATTSLVFSKGLKAEESRAVLKRNLIEALDSFGQQHSLSNNDLQMLVGQYVLDGTDIVIGRAGLIAKDTYIVFGKERNTLLLSGHTWQGEKAGEQQIVYIEGQKVIDSLDNADLSKIIIVLFSPSEVRFINLSTFLAGKYERPPS